MNPQQDIITTLRAQLSEARKTANELTDELAKAKAARNRAAMDERNKYLPRLAELEREIASHVRLDDPVVKGLVEALDGYASWTDTESVDFISAEKALAAYNARVKEVGCE